jgi:pantoate--beta-alanine ligase
MGRVPRVRTGAMKRASSIAAVRSAVARWRARGEHVGFVPTMGAIHAGHLSLVRRAQAGGPGGVRGRVVASIFVNPLQFGPHEDFRRYPRPLRRDRALLAKAGVDLLWEPRASDLYPPGHSTRVRVGVLGDILEGASRPGHFDGVATVVLKLLNVVRPHVLWLGQKDAQQALLIERMCRDLDVPVRVRRGPTVREPDGLACSSRNVYLEPDERVQAQALGRGLAAARLALAAGERSTARLARAIRKVWRGFPLVREDYVAIVDAETLEALATLPRGRRMLVAVAARVGRARLIDNFEWRTP